MPRAEWSFIGSMEVVRPPLLEQAAIVRFLDHATSRIERYICTKEKLIALLEEQKQVIVHDAVTGRIDVRTGKPYPAYKSSGLKWLGDIPAQWDIRRLKTVSRVRYGLGQPPAESASGLPFIRATNVERGQIRERDLIRVDPAEIPSSRDAILQEDEIVVVRSGAYTADSAIIPKRYAGAIAGYDMVVTATDVFSGFLAMILLSTYIRDDQLIVESMRSAQPHLNAEELGSASLLLPSPAEQTAITDYLNQMLSDTDNVIERTNREIGLLREYRTRLIADVVTGKLDVREEAAALPAVEPYATGVAGSSELDADDAASVGEAIVPPEIAS